MRMPGTHGTCARWAPLPAQPCAQDWPKSGACLKNKFEAKAHPLRVNWTRWLCLQGLKLDTDVAALMEADGETGEAAMETAQQQAQQQRQAAPEAAQQAALPEPAAGAGQQPGAEAVQEEEEEEGEEEVESMVDFLLRSRLEGTPPPAGSPAAGAAGAAASGLRVDPRLHTWHPVGGGADAALGCVADRLRQLGEVRSAGCFGCLGAWVLGCLS